MPIENSFIFFPTTYPEGDWDTPMHGSDDGPLVEDCEFHTSDGVRLHGWYCHPTGGKEGDAAVTPGTLLWCHGNAGNITHRYEMIKQFTQLSLAVFLFDYRGYGRSDGKPSEAGLCMDAEATWAYLVEKRCIPAQQIVVLGKSIGAVPALDLASRRSPAGLIIDSAFTCLSDMARVHMPLAPRFLLRTKLDAIGRVGQVACPKLFIHSRADEIVPFELGQRLYQTAAEPKAFLPIEDMGHNDIHLATEGIYYERIHQFALHCMAEHACSDPPTTATT